MPELEIGKGLPVKKDDVCKLIADLSPLPAEYTVCSWYRRGVDEGNSLNIVVPHNGWTNDLQDLPFNVEYIGKTKWVNGEQFYIRNTLINFCPVEDDYWGSTVLYLTGNTLFTLLIRNHAKQKGLKLNQYGLWDHSERIAGLTERQIFYMLDLEYVKPEDRTAQNGYKLTDNNSTIIQRG